MSTKKVWIWFALFVSLMIYPACGQTGRGTLTGSTTDAQGFVLQGVRVTLDPGGTAATSDATGQFTFTGLASGSYTVTASYVGFAPISKTVTVSAGQVARIDTVLTVQSNTQDVEVYAERQGGE